MPKNNTGSTVDSNFEKFAWDLNVVKKRTIEPV